MLGGDGTMLRALARFLGTGIPVVGVNFGRVGFLSAVARADLETGLARVFAGGYEVVELPTIEVVLAGERHVAVNDVVVTSASLGRMVELEWAVGGEPLGRVPCDGVICSTPSGSTAYNLSNGGPVLVWGIDAMAITFVAPAFAARAAARRAPGSGRARLEPHHRACRPQCSSTATRSGRRVRANASTYDSPPSGRSWRRYPRRRS